ncbi:threonine synthase [Maridesulfovibrio hydrothermalis]|uniref:Threonine synthase n=1 Tax=Maridesulfovibrio hydrothermalis AM13 = DSM 14728 TaxID=1121451 RepID=L0RE57_9BACT|nr:threonine synthase [Maridesulfovibrio hydrothermalis]CCO24487.1 Threonine synthase [Maridesulfovibrio hydrothermalis AM13 = DSM 14728]
MSLANTFPEYRAKMEYHCLGCNSRYDIKELHYTCPECGSVFILEDLTFDELKKTSGKEWRELFDARTATKKDSLRGIFRFYELFAAVMEEDEILYLGEGNTPIVASSPALNKITGIKTAYKNDGQNPSASFKDRGMACAFSYINALLNKNNWDEILTVCASTGDTSAAAALYASYMGGPVKSVVILPQGKVTPQQLAQPLGSGAKVLEVPGVFDDCMKVVEHLADNYRVALLNSKNSWRILGQESYAFEVAQWYDWDLKDKCIFVPIGNAGNITAVMAGFLKLYELEIINELPRLFGVQSAHADPVYRYYSVNDPKEREYKPVTVQPSVAQAAMIGNPVSFPRVKHFAEKFEAIGGKNAFQVVQVSEQQIMDSMLLANSNGHIACTQGGECLAGLIRAKELGLINENEMAVLDSTAHQLKFVGFQDMYYQNDFPDEYEVTPDASKANKPELVIKSTEKDSLSEEQYISKAADNVVSMLGLEKK